MKVEIASVNGQENISSELKYGLFGYLLECTPLNVNGLARLLTKEKLEGTIEVETCNIAFHDGWKITDGVNEEYRQLQLCIANGPNVCAVLGIDFNIKKKPKPLFSPTRKQKNTERYIITFENVDLNQLISRAEEFELSCINKEIQQLRKDGNDFYLHVYSSPVVDTVAQLFAEKIKELANDKLINRFGIYSYNKGITLGEYEDAYAKFFFSENGLADLSDKNQRLGFSFAVIDKITEKLKGTPVLSDKIDAPEQIQITNEMHIIFHPTIAKCYSENVEFELVFNKNKKEKQISNWF